MVEEMATLQRALTLALDFLVNYSFQLLGGMLILLAGLFVARWSGRAMLRVLERRHVDVTLREFMASTARLVVVALFVVIALGKLGISITPLIAAIGGLAVGASFAIQGPVSNYGAGLVIILTRMFRVGDTIQVQGCSGVVTHIDLATTRLEAEDGEIIVIPNKHVVGEIHRNSFGYRLVEGRVTVDAAADPALARQLIAEVIARGDGVAQTPPPQIGIEAFADGGIVIGYRYRVPSARYFELLYQVNGGVHRALSAAGIALAAPRYALARDVQA